MNLRYVMYFAFCVVICTIMQSSAMAQLNSNIRAMEWSADSSRFAVTTREGLSIFDQFLNLVAYQPFSTAFDFIVPDISLSPDGTRIFVGNATKKKILNTATLQPMIDFQDASILSYTSQWNSDGSEIAFRRGDDRGTEIYDATTGELLRSFSAQEWSYGFFNLGGYPIWSSDNAYFAGVIGGDTVIIFDAYNGQKITQYQIEDELVLDIAWSPDQINPRLALVTLAKVELGSPNSFPDLGAGGETAIRHSLIVVDAMSGSIISSTTGFRNTISGLAWSPNGMELAGSDGYRRLYVWNPNTGTLIDSFLTAPYQVEQLEYSTYGGRLLLAYNIRWDSQERADDIFAPMTTYEQNEFDGAIQFVAPASSPEKLQSILSQCATDPNVIAIGNGFIENLQYSEFVQWLGQQADSVIPAACADDLQLVTETKLATAPAAPSNLTAEVVSASRVDLTWTDNAEDETAYFVERSLDGGMNWETPIELPADSTSYSDGDLTCETEATYRVRAYRESDDLYSTYSDTVSTSTLPCTPIAYFTADPTTGNTPLEVSFTNQSTGTITSYAWDFDGDEVIDSTDQNPSPYTYENAGTYVASLVVSGPGGTSAPATVTIEVTEPPVAPVAAFTANPLTGDVPLTVSFTNQSTGEITDYAWDFDGDEVVDSTDADPDPYTYEDAGTYVASLIVSGLGGTSGPAT